MGEHISFFAQQLLIFHHQVGKILSREKEVRRIPADQDLNLIFCQFYLSHQPGLSADSRRSSISLSGRLARIAFGSGGNQKTGRIIKNLVRNSIPISPQFSAAGIVKRPQRLMYISGWSLTDLHNRGRTASKYDWMRLVTETLSTDSARADLILKRFERI